MYAALRNRFQTWLFQWRGPETGEIVLVQRRVFILPTRQGLVFAVVLLVMLAGSINYSLGLGFVLTFLLGALGVNAMIYTFRNLANLRVSGGRVRPVYAGDTIYAESEVLEARESKSRPEQGIVTVRTTGRKADGTAFMSFERAILVPRRGHAVDD